MLYNNITIMRLTKLNDLIDEGEVVGGKWDLNKKHEIRYRERGKDSQVRFKARILDVKPASIVLASTSRQEDQKTVTRIHELTGTWRADAKNHLTFNVKRQTGRSDILIFAGSWQVNKNHEIEYIYLKFRK